MSTRQKFTEMSQHIDHEVKLSLDDYGGVSLYCMDCGEIAETWERPYEPIWHGRQYFKETGDEPNTGDIMMEKGENQ